MRPRGDGGAGLCGSPVVGLSSVLLAFAEVGAHAAAPLCDAHERGHLVSEGLPLHRILDEDFVFDDDEDLNALQRSAKLVTIGPRASASAVVREAAGAEALAQVSASPHGGGGHGDARRTPHVHRAASGAEVKRVGRASTVFLAHRMLVGGVLWPLVIGSFFVSLVVTGACCTCIFPLVTRRFPESVLLEKRPCLVMGIATLVVCIACVVSIAVVENSLQAGHLELIHIPKNAGTSMEAAGKANGIFWSAKNLGLLGVQHMEDCSTCNRYHVPPGLLKGHSPYQEAIRFCSIRHPYSRAVSEYTYLLDDHLQGTRAWGHKFYERYHNGLYDRKPCSSEGLNHFIMTTMKLYKQGHKFIDDCHHVPQVDYIWDKTGRQWCTELLVTDDLPRSFDSLMASYGYPVQLSDEPFYTSTERCPKISEANLTAETRRLLDEVYADDFRLLNFTPY